MSRTPLRRRPRVPGASAVREGGFLVVCPTWPSATGRRWWCAGFTAEHANHRGRPPVRSAAAAAPGPPLHRLRGQPQTRPAARATITDLAGHYAHALRGDLQRAGLHRRYFTGGSIAQQLAIDHPQLVGRLVLVAAACRLGPAGGACSATWPGSPWLAGPGAPGRPPARAGHYGRRGRLYGALLWLAGLARSGSPSDMLMVIDAEDRFDAAPSRIASRPQP